MARAQDSPREAGERFRAELRKAPPRAALAPDHPKDAPAQGEVRLGAYLGLARVGEIDLHTEIQDKGGEKLYVIEDRLDMDAPGFGVVHMLVTGDLAPDLSVRELVLETESPGPAGAIVRRRVAVAPEDGVLVVTDARDEQKAEKHKLAGTDSKTLFLTPPLGVGERLTRLAKGDVGSRLSFDAFDLAQGKAATLSLSFEEASKIDLRGEKVTAQKVARAEGDAALEAWLDPRTREPLELFRGETSEPRVTFVGREPASSADLPAPGASARAAEGPAEVVLRFLRATGKADVKAAQEEIASTLDVDALYARATEHPPAGVDPKDARFRKVFEKALLGRLTSDEWRRGEGVKLLTGAARASDLATEVSGDKATVRPKSAPEAPAFELEKRDGVWRITRLPGG